MFATEASVILRDAGADVSDDQPSRRLAQAQRTRQVIALAQGVIMERDGMSEDDAYTWLRSSSQRTNRPLSQGAAAVVGSAGRSRPGLPEDSDGTPRMAS